MHQTKCNTEDEARQLIRKEMQILDQDFFQDPSFVVGSSGTMRTLYNMIEENVQESDKSQESFFSFSQENLDILIKTIISKSVEELRQFRGLEPERADLIVMGAILVDEILKNLNLNKVLITQYSLREGIWEEVMDQLS